MVAVVIAFVALSAAYNYVTPVVTPAVLHAVDGGAANADEIAHMLYVKRIASGHLPVFSSSSPNYEAHQPPLYYCAAALLFLAGRGNAVAQVHDARWAATLLGIALIWITYSVVRQLLPNREDIAVGTAMVVALLPMNISLSSSVSNDTAANVIFAFALLLFGRILRHSDAWLKNGLLLALVFAAGIWTKSSTLLLILLGLILFGCAVWQKNVAPRPALYTFGLGLIGGAILSSFWLLRNQRLYGDFFAQNVIFHDLAARNISPSALIDLYGQGWYMRHFFDWTFASYWGVFDSMNLFLPTAVYIVLAVLSVPAAILGLAQLATTLKSSVERAEIVMWIALILLTVAAYVQYNAHFFQLQGRYLYPALIPLSASAVYLLYSWTPKPFARWAGLTLFVGLFFLNLLSLAVISGRFAT
jgi:hypothetical protein